MSDEIREHENGHSNKMKPIIILKTHITKTYESLKFTQLMAVGTDNPLT